MSERAHIHRPNGARTRGDRAYATKRGRLELDNTFHRDPRAKAAARELLTVRLPLQLEQQLPPPYQLQSDAAKARYLRDRRRA